MTTAVVLSDSHGHRSAVARIAPLFEENDLIIFLGDGVGDLYAAQTQYSEKTYLCRGNNDFSGGAYEWVIEEDGCRIYCCHGHRLGVKHGLERLAQEAKEHGCEIALYGHTHRAAIDLVDGVLCINPGAIGSFADASYCYLVLHKGKATPTIVPLA